jgi:hypothetical protein
MGEGMVGSEAGVVIAVGFAGGFNAD